MENCIRMDKYTTRALRVLLDGKDSWIGGHELGVATGSPGPTFIGLRLMEDAGWVESGLIPTRLDQPQRRPRYRYRLRLEAHPRARDSIREWERTQSVWVRSLERLFALK